jgi:hypothetical protein
LRALVTTAPIVDKNYQSGQNFSFDFSTLLPLLPTILVGVERLQDSLTDFPLLAARAAFSPS